MSSTASTTLPDISHEAQSMPLSARPVRKQKNNSQRFIATEVRARNNAQTLAWVMISFFAVLLAVRLFGIFTVPFTDTTEARYAEIARKMVASNNWITPMFDNGIPFWGKPPLHTWLSALGMKIFGVNEFGARIFIFATALGIVGLIFNWVKQQSNSRHAVLAAMILSSTWLFYGASAFVMTDIAMMFGLVLSMIGFFNATQISNSIDNNRKLWGNCFFVGLSVGMLAKGPVAVILTGIPIFFWLLMGRRWAHLARLPWVSGILWFAVLTLPWYVLAELKTPGFLSYFFIGEHINRFLVSGWEGDLYGTAHTAPKGMIWVYGFAAMMPWTLFAIGLITQFKPITQAVKIDSQSDGWRSYLGYWVLSPLLLFTVAGNILPAYALPVVPPASILLVIFWQDAFGKNQSRKSHIIFFITLATTSILFTYYIAMAVIAPDAINLKSQRVLVSEAQAYNPDIQLNYYLGRSFSGEFYTQGEAKTLIDDIALMALSYNTTPDAVAVYRDREAGFEALLDSIMIPLERVGVFGRYVLYVEASSDLISAEDIAIYSESLALNQSKEINPTTSQLNIWFGD